MHNQEKQIPTLVFPKRCLIMHPESIIFVRRKVFPLASWLLIVLTKALQAFQSCLYNLVII